MTAYDKLVKGSLYLFEIYFIYHASNKGEHWLILLTKQEWVGTGEDF